jgi:2,4-dienoyl-CoA reductase-like NADH-dependent reductase (Old Yellow Enzyme family)
VDPDLTVPPPPDASLAALWEPVDLGPVRLLNRVVMTALTTLWSRDGTLSERHLDHFEERARGGVGLVVTEQQTADGHRRAGFPDGLDALAPGADERFAALAERVHPHGTRVLAQLYAPGTQDVSGLDLDWWHAVSSPSDVPGPGHRESPRVLDAAEVSALVASFGRAAAVVARGGLDGVELHGAHGWLLHRFLSPLFNRRTDAYGGTAARRCRLLLEIAGAVRAELGPERVLGVQVSVSDHTGTDGRDGHDGLTVPLALEQLDHLVASGLFDYVNLSTGQEFSEDQTLPPLEHDHVPSEAAGRDARRRLEAAHGSARPLVLVQGGIHDVHQAAGLVASGAADLVGLARPLLEEPHYVVKAQSGRVGEMTPHLADGTPLRRAVGLRPVVALLNPVAGREGRWGLDRRRRAEVSRSVAVVGAGPAGMHAAITAAERGHRVTLLERDGEVGGHLRLLAALPHRARWHEAIAFHERRARALGVELRLGETVSPDTVLDGFDGVLVATGSVWSDAGFQAARPAVPRLPRGGQDRVLPVDEALRSALLDPHSLGRHVVVLDETGGHLPLGLADLLSAAGVRVGVVSGAAVVGAAVRAVSDTAVLARLAGRDVTLVADAVVDGIEAGVVTLTEGWSGRGSRVEGVDTLVLCTYRDPVRALDRVHRRTRVVGDARTPRELPESLADAHDAAYSLQDWC